MPARSDGKPESNAENVSSASARRETGPVAATNIALLHGGGQGSWIWSETIAALKEQSGGAATCLALDVPGCGEKRGRDTSAVEFDDIARELNADIDAAGMHNVVVVGHSQAGMAIPRMAEFAPKLFRQLIYVTCSAPTPGTSILELMGSCVQGEREDRVGYPLDPKTTPIQDQFGVMFCSDMSPPQRDAFLAQLGPDMWPLSSYVYRDWRYEHLGSIPSAYVVCEKDMSLHPRWQQRFADTLRVGTTVGIDAGHQVMNTRPQELAEVLLAQLHH